MWALVLEILTNLSWISYISEFFYILSNDKVKYYVH